MKIAIITTVITKDLYKKSVGTFPKYDIFFIDGQYGITGFSKQNNPTP